MPELTRRRDPDALQETWLVYYGDVHAGTIAIRSGNPTDTTGEDFVNLTGARLCLPGLGAS